MLCLPTYLQTYLPTYSICCHLILSLHPTRLYLSPTALPPSLFPPRTSALRADKVPRSHSTALAPCIGPARVNTAQPALDPDPLAFLRSALLLGLSCTTNRRSGHNLNSPTATALPTQFASAARLFCLSRTGHLLLLLLCSTTALLCPALSLPASRLPLPAVVHKHFLAAPPTTVSAAARQPAHHTRRFALSHRACACCPTHSSRWERTVTCQQPTLPTTLLLRPCMDLSRTSKHQAPLSLPARKVASHFTSYNDRNSTPNTTRATPLGLTADVQVRRQPCPSPSLQTGFSTASCACRS